MTASLTLTPSQARFIQEHKARRERFAAKARPDTPVLCLSASARAQRAEVTPAAEPTPIPPVQAWVQRQIRLYKPWFSIECEINTHPLALRSMGEIQRICADYYSVSMTDMLSIRRFKRLVLARQVAMFLCKEFTLRSMPEIGIKFGGRDHTTVLHAIRKINRLESGCMTLAAELNVLRQQIREVA